MARWQRRHYETIAAGLKAKNAPRTEIDEWIRKFQADNPRFQPSYFIAAATGSNVSLTTRAGRTISREYRNRSRPKRKFKVPSLSGYRTKSGRCKFGKIKRNGRKVCRRSPRRK
jgi:hypothetical protein